MVWTSELKQYFQSICFVFMWLITKHSFLTPYVGVLIQYINILGFKAAMYSFLLKIIWWHLQLTNFFVNKYIFYWSALKSYFICVIVFKGCHDPLIHKLTWVIVIVSFSKFKKVIILNKSSDTLMSINNIEP